MQILQSEEYLIVKYNKFTSHVELICRHMGNPSPTLIVPSTVLPLRTIFGNKNETSRLPREEGRH